MNEDPQLTNFLRQHRSIAPPASSELEDRLMSRIEPLPAKKKRRISRKWWRYLEFSMGILVTGILGVTIHQVMNPAADIANIQQLDRYLEAHWHRLGSNPVVDIDRDPMAELEAYLLQSDDDVEDI